MSAAKPITFTINTVDAVASLLPVANFVSKGKDHPMLTNVYCKMANDELFVLATNSGQCFAKSIALPLQSVPDFEICLDGAKLRSIIASLKDSDQMKFTIEETSVVISAGRSKLKCPALGAEAYPTPPRVTEETFTMNMAAADLLKLIKRTKHAIASGDVRYYLNGLNVVCCDGKITANATDGHRCSTYSLEGQKFSGSANVIVPKSMVDLLASDKSLEQNKSFVRIRMDANMIEVLWAAGMLRSQVIDGRFPDVNRLVNVTNVVQATFDRKALTTSLNRIRGIAAASIKLENNQNELRMFALGENRELSGEDFVEGAVCEAGFNSVFSLSAGYLSDALNAFDEDDLTISLSQTGSLMMSSKSCVNKMEIVMPMRD